MKPIWIRLVAILFLCVTTLISLLQPSFELFAWIYFPSLAIYEALVIYSFIRDKRLRKG